MSPMAPMAARSSMAFWVSSVGLTLPRNICFNWMPSWAKSSATFALMAALSSSNIAGMSNRLTPSSPRMSVSRLMMMPRR